MIILLKLSRLGCVTMKWTDTDPIPPELRSPLVQYFVVRDGEDHHWIHHLIAQEIEARGPSAIAGYTSERRAQLDVLVVYESLWLRDLGNHLVFLRIDLRDPETSALLATGSYQSFTRRPAARVVALILEGMFAKPLDTQ